MCEGEVSLDPDSEVIMEETLPVHFENYVGKSGLSEEAGGGTVEGEPFGMTLTDNITSDSSGYFSGEFVSQPKGVSDDHLLSIFNVSRENFQRRRVLDIVQMNWYLDMKFVVPLQFLLITESPLNRPKIFWIMLVVFSINCMSLEQLPRENWGSHRVRWRGCLIKKQYLWNLGLENKY